MTINFKLLLCQCLLCHKEPVSSLESTSSMRSQKYLKSEVKQRMSSTWSNLTEDQDGKKVEEEMKGKPNED